MEQPGAPEFILEAFADPNSVREVVKGILHTIFFLRFFPSVLPQTRDVFGLELAYVPEAEIETLIDQRVTALARQLELERNQPHQPQQHHLRHQGPGGTGPASSPSLSGGGGGNGSGRGQVTIQFFEKRRPKAWYNMRGDHEICWESWTVKVTVAEPRTEGERAKVRKATETTLQNTIMNIITLVNTHKDHLPPITSTEVNPFPFQININQHKEAGWAARMGIY
ncbi:autophagy-related protein [Lasiosphaeria hispida]|uniref:Autophagy-related protein 101 n=1 Tax=Lasiosphaeria hispida TaxID=260671 RepID=A0AAJ0HML9_9PEZI|nr:autophagy-related protein [Lasiosphaeria hispida]